MSRFVVLALFAACLALLFRQPAIADGAPTPMPSPSGPPPQPKFELIKKVGEAVRLEWVDGREAIYTRDTVISDRLVQSFEVTENTCNSKGMPTCKLLFSFKLATMQLRWSKHPDAARIGQVVQMRYSGGSSTSEASTQSIVTSTEAALRLPYVGEGLLRDEIACGDYGWLGGAGAVPPAQVLISRWGVEGMEQNPETRLNENRVRDGALDVVLEATSENRLVFASAKQYVSKGSNVNLYGGDIVAWILRQGDGNCQYSLKPEPGTLDRVVIEFITSHKTATTPLIYVPGECGDDSKCLQAFAAPYNPSTEYL